VDQAAAVNQLAVAVAAQLQAVVANPLAELVVPQILAVAANPLVVLLQAAVAKQHLASHVANH